MALMAMDEDAPRVTTQKQLGWLHGHSLNSHICSSSSLYSGADPHKEDHDAGRYLKSIDRGLSTAPPTAANTEESLSKHFVARHGPGGPILNSSNRLPLPKPMVPCSSPSEDFPSEPYCTRMEYKIPPAQRGHLSLIGTPIDLTTFFYPSKWVANRFRVIQTIAPAIHGEVRYVLDIAENKAVVVKVIHNAAVRPRKQGELENPLVEIGAMTYLHSKEARYPVDLVAKLNGVYQDAKYTYLVTEFCSGGELFREIISRKSFNESFVKAVALQLALALLSLHKNGICHRDVSLENTLLKQDKTVRLIDFGQAEVTFDADGCERYMYGSAGKDYYRAPEMLQGKYQGPPVDVFALGVEIFIMAIGSRVGLVNVISFLLGPPWQEASENDCRYRTLTKRPEAVDITLRKWGKRDAVSDAFVDMLAWIFCTTPARRPTIENLLLHPWFACDPTVWRWVCNKGHSVTIKAQAERLDAYLRVKPNGEYFFLYKNGRHIPISRAYGPSRGSSILGHNEGRRKDTDRSITRHRRPH